MKHNYFDWVMIGIYPMIFHLQHIFYGWYPIIYPHETPLVRGFTINAWYFIIIPHIFDPTYYFDPWLVG